ncbi:MAG: hypothetical protein K8W52_15415 [Deltaproteobacteria bacterium]|nr:hypothetical protein [Deltaproteobacteria bacterium]
MAKRGVVSSTSSAVGLAEGRPPKGQREAWPVDEIDLDEQRACEWLADWVAGKRARWTGPVAVVIRLRHLVITMHVAEEPVDVSAPPGERLRLRIAPGEAPPVHLDYEPDSDHASALVHAVVYVPPSLATR